MKTTSLDSSALDLQTHGLADLKKGNPHNALARFKVATKLAPTLPGPRLDYARLLTRLFQLDEARHQIETTLTHHPLDPTLNLAAAQLLTEARFPDLALQILLQFPDQETARFHAASLLERMGRLPEAQEQLTSIHTFDAQYLKARLASRQGNPSSALEILRALQKHANKSWPAARLAYALGSAHDALGNYPAAFKSWTLAKDHLKPLAGTRLTDSRKELSQNPSLSRAQLLSLQKRTPSLDKPNLLFLTGFPRTGTTLLDRLLTRSYHARSADENTAYRDLITSKISRPSDYQTALRNLAGAPPSFNGFLIDKNPQLFPSLSQILRNLPHLPVLKIHRDPRDVLVSCFAQPFGLNHHSVHYLDPAWFTHRYLAVMKNAHQLEDTLEDQQTTLNYQDLVTHPQKTIATIARTLGLQRSTSAQNESRLSYSPTYAEIEKPVSTLAIARWKNYQPWLAPHFETLLKESP